MAHARSKAKSASGYSRIETNIYRESRSGALRFKVLVHPLKPFTKTVDPADEADGLDWARATRLELLRQKRGLPGAAQRSANRPDPAVRPSTTPRVPAAGRGETDSPGAVTVNAVLKHYEDYGIPLLSTANSRSAETSRVKKLRAMLGVRTLDDLTEAELEGWIQRRLRGEGGGGRSAWRKKTPPSAKHLPFPRVSSPAAALLAKRHVPESIASLRQPLAARLLANLGFCPCCLRSRTPQLNL